MISNEAALIGLFFVNNSLIQSNQEKKRMRLAQTI